VLTVLPLRRSCREPWVSLGPILVASGLTTLEGLLLFGLRKPAYDLSLGGVAPCSFLSLERLRASPRP